MIIINFLGLIHWIEGKGSILKHRRIDVFGNWPRKSIELKVKSSTQIKKYWKRNWNKTFPFSYVLCCIVLFWCLLNLPALFIVSTYWSWNLRRKFRTVNKIIMHFTFHRIVSPQWWIWIKFNHFVLYAFRIRSDYYYYCCRQFILYM